MTKRRYDGELAKQIIAEKATELFSLKGYTRTSIEDIAKASGYSKGHIYYHYKNKENLFVYLAKNSMRNWHEKWITAEKDYKNATEKLYGMANYVLYNYTTPLLKAGQELASDPSTNSSTVQQLYGLAVVPLTAYQQILDEGIKSGEFFINNIENSSLLLGAWLGGLCQFIYSIETEKLELLFEEAITIFLLSISNKPV
ncbi:TetR family transcriptional regulator [Bacillus cereus]|uniref:TetR family transcriptional regulator C-terminal domain-containing protein n=1 Tax=Bacillus TaxID=1386 RepID=UPI000652931A|nr:MULTISPECIES: TetR family transcriptional regulator C-terminal domain-containing protein [Bacillus]PFM60444.1 TetR family transcriptional regulator [Bacillus cereus]KMN44274.1 TetR family transcriptional regulator [Bacillus sp. LK2]MED0987287.1 TetR family transcriptional regulator C-terminal domain-containing protein [Bacillus paramycoides]MED1091016.1 TetR family transcriptional regulator C-terminal domain-containing protein [Bacillus paramycoides]PGP78018.1 TetR family transcriptional re